MCEECLRRYHDMDKRVIDIMDEMTPEFIAFADKLAAKMDEKIGRRETEVMKADGTTCLLTDLPLEEQEELKNHERLARQVSIVSFITGFISYRFCDGTDEAIGLLGLTEGSMQSGREMGQVTKVFVKNGQH